MRYIIELNHPKHYYQFRQIVKILQKDGHDILFVAHDKDILLSILQEEHVDYVLLGHNKSTMIAKLCAAWNILRSYRKIINQFHPDVIISKASPYGTVIGRIKKIKTVIFPDSEVVKLTNKFVAPNSDMVITPESFQLDYGRNHKRVKGFFENCYLSPLIFTPQKSIISEYSLQSPYVILRFSGWSANHDVNQSGFSLDEKKKLIDTISKYMTVYISSEKVLPKELQRYQLNTPSSKMHDVLAFADLYIGDSQTMATEAALLGTPAIRSNSFVGPNDMSNFKVLESRYKLLHNVARFEDVLALVENYVQKSRKNEWQEKCLRYNQEIGDINQEIINYLYQL